MLKACIEIISTGQSTWIEIPNGDLSAAISDFTSFGPPINESRDWECTIITGLKQDGITSFVNNSFHKCDIFELNDLLLAQPNVKEIEDYVVLNLLLEDRNHNCEEVEDIFRHEQYKVYKDAEHMGDVAMEYLENTSSWYQEAKENCYNFDAYFDFKSYGEEILGSDGNWLQDKNYKIIVEVYE